MLVAEPRRVDAFRLAYTPRGLSGQRMCGQEDQKGKESRRTRILS